MVRVAQELARYWGLQLVGVDPASHQLQGWPYRWTKRVRRASACCKYKALWGHFDGSLGRWLGGAAA